MKVKAYKPKNEMLASLIDCYYLLSRDDSEPTTTYLTFPSVFSIHSIALNTKIVQVESRYIIQQDKQQSFLSEVVCRFNSALCFEYRGGVNEITIYFKPLGLNAFLTKDLSSYPEGITNSFIPFFDFENTMTSILRIQNDDAKVESLENYLLSKHIGFSHPFMHLFIADLYNDVEGVTIADLCKKYSVSQKTVIKHFEKHVCKTPVEFRKIIRFRKALNKFHQQKEQLSMTELSYILNYFDQSHLIREFKSLTGYTPIQFFKRISPLESGKINWMFL
jgi:AraC-like DNA-binding protein